MFHGEVKMSKLCNQNQAGSITSVNLAEVMSRVLLTARIGLILGICFNSWKTHSQPIEVKNYPRQYFRNPLGVPLELSANFGELRPNHWHMGLDIRTKQKENLPVYAAAEGYIAKIGIRPQSFG